MKRSVGSNCTVKTLKAQAVLGSTAYKRCYKRTMKTAATMTNLNTKSISHSMIHSLQLHFQSISCK